MKLTLRALAGATVVVITIAVAAVASERLTSNASQDTGAASRRADEGVRVHGRWVIEVRSSSGDLTQRVEFDNALTSGGAFSLSRFITGQLAPGRWAVALSNTTPASRPCVDASGSTVACITVDPSSSSFIGSPNAFGTLSVTTPPTGSNSVQLEGTVNAGRDGAIDVVSTLIGNCGPSTIAPASCTVSGNTFTQATITPVSVVAGQQILVRVTFSFS